MTDTSKEAVERLAQEYDDRVKIFDGVIDATPESVRELRRERNSKTRQQHVDTAATLRALVAERDALAARVVELEAENGRLREEKEDAVDTLDAWFDRRKLGHEEVDQAVVDAASGYLRTSRVGGMGQDESDLILGVMQDMARLGLFADLFARTTLAAIKEGGE